jgi:two-component system NtrC family sensor kinase
MLRGERVPMAQSIAGWVARYRQPVTLHGTVSDPRFAPAYPRHDITAVVLPMLAGGRLLGILSINATRRRRPFTPGQVKALSIFANLAAAALSNASLYAQVRQSEERFRAVSESATDAIISADSMGRIASWNRGARELFGYTSDDIVGRPIELLVPIPYRDVVVSGMQRLAAAGQQRLCEKASELCGLTRDGREFPLELSLSSWQTADGTFFSAIIRDITGRKQAEEELHRQREAAYQAERLATMGQLLAGIAHELNNPLSVVLGQASLLHADARGGLLAERAQEILRAAERCARIVRNFLALARQRPPERQQVHLNHVVQEVVELLAYTLRANAVHVHLHLADELPPLWADPDQLHQVVLNLSTNAYQAMVETPTPRRLTFTTQFDDERARVILEVADTGPGILPEIATRIFEPFSTTKPLGVGTGLGLSLCKGIVEGHGGTISVESQSGHGAVFRIDLPVGVAPVVAPLSHTVKAPLPLQGRTILVVDDEPTVASILAQMLALDGHRVEVATNGAMALDKLQQQSFDLILSDMRMPELDGPGLYRQLACRYPKLLQQIIFLTGDALGPQVQAFLEQTQVPSLDKPFTLGGLRRVVHQVLQEVTW